MCKGTWEWELRFRPKLFFSRSQRPERHAVLSIIGTMHVRIHPFNLDVSLLLSQGRILQE